MATFLKNKLHSFIARVMASIQQQVSKEDAPLSSIVLLGVLLYFTWTLLLALIVYKQFSALQIIVVSGSFLTIFFLFIYFFTDLLKRQLALSGKNILYALILFALMVLLASTFSPMADIYIHTYPLLETELGLGWHQDTAYHASHIQSILHFGYPSIGQHGVPLNMYHVLSHYVDALIVWVAQVEPYDSYGLLATFKIWLLVSSIAVFFAAVVKGIHPLFYFIGFVFLAPIMTGTWHAVFSHGLWFTTILVIFSSLKIFKLFMADSLNNKDYLFIFIILLLVSLGKVSTGFMYALLIGIFLLIKYPKDKRVYLLGGLLGAFFSFYSAQFQTKIVEGGASSYDFSVLSFNYYWETIFHPFLSLEHILPQNPMILVGIAILGALAFLYKDKSTLYFLCAAIASHLLLITISGVSVKFGPSDVFYFYLGFTYVLNLFVFMFIVHSLRVNKELYRSRINIFYTVLLIGTLFIPLLYTSSGFPCSFHKIQSSLKSIDDRPFSKINRVLPNERKMSVSKLFLGQVTNTDFVDFRRPLYHFREKINQTLTDHQVSKKEVLLFVAKETYVNDISRFGGARWADGMLLYAITGVSMLYAIKDHAHRGYAQGSYLKEYEWKHSSSFDSTLACNNNKAKLIIELVDFDSLAFKTYPCEQKK